MKLSLPRIPRKVRLPKKFSCRHDASLLLPSEALVTDFISEGQCKTKTGPHGYAMVCLQDHVPSVNSRDSRSFQTLCWKKNKGVKDKQGAKKRPGSRRKKTLYKASDPPPPSSHLYYDFGDLSSQALAKLLCPPGVNVVEINEWDVVDNFGIDGRRHTKHLVCFDPSGGFLFAKLSQRKAGDHVGGFDRVAALVRMLELQAKWRPQIIRGQLRGSKTQKSYTLHGIHKNPNGNGVVKYKWKKKTPVKVKEECERLTNQLQLNLERSCRSVCSGLVESFVAEEVSRAVKLPRRRIKGIKKLIQTLGTALAMGMNYWSPSHTDKDLYLTALTFLFPEGFLEENFNEVLQNFCFPDFKVRVPMRAGEVLIFNPLIAHCCSNPRFENSFTVSSFMSLLTVKEAASEILKA